MKILFVVTRADTIGGAHVHVRDMATRLCRDGHEVLVATGNRGPFTEALDHAGIRSVTCPPLQRAIHPGRDLRAVAAARTIVRDFAPHLVSTHSSKAGIVGRLATRLTGTPCLFTAHGWAFTDGVPEPRRTVYRWLERGVAPLAARIICVSEHDRSLALAAGIAAHRLTTIHNGMPDIPAHLRADPATESPIRIAMIARFDRQKDHTTLLNALRDLGEVHLDLIGDGPTLVTIQTLAATLGVADRVHFLGHRSDVAQILARAQIFALVSHWEGFPRSTLEAMRAGLPVIVSNVGGAAEAIEEGVTGYAVPRGDVHALRDRLSVLTRDPALRQGMGAAGRRRYEADFTFDRMYGQTLRIYREVLPGA